MSTKNKKIRFFPKDEIAIEATDRLTKLKSEPKNPEMAAEIDEWLDENPRNKMELALMDAIWDYSGVLKDHPLVIEDITEHKVGKTLQRKGFHCFRLGWASIRTITVAAIILLIVTGLWMIKDDANTFKIYQTVTGEQKTVFLEDGSAIHLDTKTVIASAYSADSRYVELKSGRALFTINHEPGRPFIVSVGEVFVRALGTQFDVYKEKNGRVSVAVSEGLVRVGQKLDSPVSKPEKKSSKNNEPLKLPERMIAYKKTDFHRTAKVIGTGQKIVLDERKEAIEVQNIDVKHIGAWRNGKLYFRGAPLEDVIDEVNRYFNNKIRIGDKKLNDIRLSMVFRVKDHKYFIDTLEEAIAVRHEKSLNGQIVLHARDQS